LRGASSFNLRAEQLLTMPQLSDSFYDVLYEERRFILCIFIIFIQHILHLSFLLLYELRFQTQNRLLCCTGMLSSGLFPQKVVYHFFAVVNMNRVKRKIFLFKDNSNYIETLILELIAVSV
jgi:hypothetical protein